MEQLSVAVCGCTINSATYIASHLEYLSELSSLFRNLNIIIYENDSQDNTVEVLKNLEKQGKIKLITEKNIKSILKHRTAIIAHGRNKLVNYIANGNYDYMIMIDLDTILSKPIINSIKNAFRYDCTKWDVLTGNSPTIYYDIWALRINRDQWSPLHNKIWKVCPDYDIWDMISHRRQMGKNEKFFHTKSYQKHIPSSFPLIAVTSAFNGIGIYKVSVIKNCMYNGYSRNCTCLKYKVRGRCIGSACEHVSFHTDIVNKNKGRIFICPSLLVVDQPEHLQ